MSITKRCWNCKDESVSTSSCEICGGDGVIADVKEQERLEIEIEELRKTNNALREHNKTLSNLLANGGVVEIVARNNQVAEYIADLEYRLDQHPDERNFKIRVLEVLEKVLDKYYEYNQYCDGEYKARQLAYDLRDAIIRTRKDI